MIKIAIMEKMMGEVDQKLESQLAWPNVNLVSEPDYFMMGGGKKQSGRFSWNCV